MHKIGQSYTCGSETCAHQLKEDGVGPQGSINNSVPETYRERATKTLQRFKLSNQNTGTTLHTAALLHHVHESEVSFQWSGNCLPEPNSATGTLANFYKIHSSTQDKVAAYIDNIPQQFRRVATGPKSRILCLEFHVNMDMRTVSESSASVSSLAKRGRPSLPKGSRFSSRGRGTVPLIAKTQSSVTLQKFTISVDPANFEAEIIKIHGEINGMLWDNHFAKGAMKVAFDLVLFDLEGREERVVAKRLYRISDDDPDSIHNHISLMENRVGQLQAVVEPSPTHALEFPELFGALDCRIAIPQEAIDNLREQLTEEEGPREDYQTWPGLTPEFNVYATDIYIRIGEPELTLASGWDVFVEMACEIAVDSQ
ncbi:hypothetical protein B0H17DRAFT_1151071 [Mycena rosella]|uniref:Uncharacterized protein n=1 Tax=Mycena rosella TaxID=1033263 RepID=A0AAD7BNQ1_MYCRO|nr:hypothetical protein B0H17DRAFT_1151071 [Mycena rosella]